MYAATFFTTFFVALAAAAGTDKTGSSQVQIKDFSLKRDPSQAKIEDSVKSLSFTLIGTDGEEVKCTDVDNCGDVYSAGVLKGTEEEYTVLIYKNPGKESDVGITGQTDIPTKCTPSGDKVEECKGEDITIALN